MQDENNQSQDNKDLGKILDKKLVELSSKKRLVLFISSLVLFFAIRFFSTPTLIAVMVLIIILLIRIFKKEDLN